jgi:hypothetical protein
MRVAACVFVHRSDRTRLPNTANRRTGEQARNQAHSLRPIRNEVNQHALPTRQPQGPIRNEVNSHVPRPRLNPARRMADH